MKNRTVERQATLTTALYVSNMPYMPIKDVKDILAASPINIQKRDIRNLSWIDKQILEILVDSNHADRMKNRIGKNSDYYVKLNFDPLSSDSFHWDGNIVPESKLAVLKRNLALRLSASIKGTKKESTRQYIMEWGTNQGIGKQLEDLARKDGIVISTPKPTPAILAQSGYCQPRQFAGDAESKTLFISASASKHGKRKLSICSEESIER